MTDSIKVMTGGYGYTTIDDMDAKIDAARLEGIRLGLEAAADTLQAHDTRPGAWTLIVQAVRDLNPDTIAARRNMTRDNLEKMRADAERYRYLCQYQGWPEDIEAALECGSKDLIDAVIDERIAREAQDMGSEKEAKDD